MKRQKLIFLFLFLGIAAFALWLTIPSGDEPGERSPALIHRSEPAFQPEGILYFVTPSNLDTLAQLTMEIAEDPNEISIGLMNRSTLQPDQSMLFIFSEEDVLSFWMKDTRISLDIIFVNNDLEIVHIAEYTIPFSKDPIPSIYPARYVVEVNAGYCRAHDIKIDDLIRFYKKDDLISVDKKSIK